MPCIIFPVVRNVHIAQPAPRQRASRRGSPRGSRPGGGQACGVFRMFKINCKLLGWGFCFVWGVGAFVLFCVLATEALRGCVERSHLLYQKQPSDATGGGAAAVASADASLPRPRPRRGAPASSRLPHRPVGNLNSIYICMYICACTCMYIYEKDVGNTVTGTVSL